MTARAPIGAPPLWTAVVDRDGGQCTCTGACGRRHTTPAAAGKPARRRGPGANALPAVVARCTAGGAGERLLVVPTDPSVPDHDAWKLPATALTTRCEPCARAATTRARHGAPVTDPDTDPVIDADTDPAADGVGQVGQLSLLDLDTTPAAAPATPPSTPIPTRRKACVNITEANATQTLLAWVLALRTIETGPDAPSDQQLHAAVAVLAEKSHRALGAGIWREDAEQSLSHLLRDVQGNGSARADRSELHP